MDIITKDNTVVLTERETNPKSNCIGKYDLGAEIGPIPNGNYELVVRQEKDEIAKISLQYDSSLNKKIHLYPPRSVN